MSYAHPSYYDIDMLVRQSINSFIRTNDSFGYIVNQATRLDRMYNETGIDYLSVITRQAQNVEDLVKNKLIPLYDNVSYDTVYQDFLKFILELADLGFLVIGDSPAEIDAKEAISLPTVKGGSGHERFYIHTEDSKVETTQSLGQKSSSLTPFLMSLQFELTSKCNERCIHCYIPNNKKDNGRNMSLSLFKNIIDQFRDMGGVQVSLSGGEVFMHPQLIEMISYCREKDMQVSLLSNLVYLKDNHISFIKEANVAMVQTSLYSMNPKTHDAITKVTGSFIKTKSAIEKLVDSDIPVTISCPILKANKKDYKDILDYAHSLGIKAQTDFILMAKENLDTSNLVNRITLDDAAIIIRWILDNNRMDTDDFVKRSNAQNKGEIPNENIPLCAAGVNNLCITSNGDAYPCSGWQAYKAGNLEEHPLKDIWDNSPILKKLRSIRRSDFPQCVQCEASEFCSICMARNHNESGGDPFKINPHFCEIAFLNKKIYEEVYG